MESWSSITGRFTTIYPHPSPRISSYRHQEIRLIFRSKGELKQHCQKVRYYIQFPESHLIATKKLDWFSQAKVVEAALPQGLLLHPSPRIASYCHQESDWFSEAKESWSSIIRRSQSLFLSPLKIRLIFKSNLLTIISKSQSQSSDRHREIRLNSEAPNQHHLKICGNYQRRYLSLPINKTGKKRKLL